MPRRESNVLLWVTAIFGVLLVLVLAGGVVLIVQVRQAGRSQPAGSEATGPAAAEVATQPSKPPAEPSERPQPWVPSPGDACRATGIRINYTDGSSAIILAADVLAHDRLVKYVEASDGKGIAELLGRKRAFEFKQNEVEVKLLRLHRSRGIAEVRVLGGDQQEAIVELGYLKKG